MKKSLIALAVLATAGVASAQSSVTLFGIVDVAVQRISSGGTGPSVTRMASGAYNTSRLGLRGTEDLGGGMSASFWIEGDIFPDNGSAAATNVNNQASPAPLAAGTQGLTFNRRSTVSLAGGWGEVRLGRDYTPQFWNLVVFDPYGVVGSGGNLPFTSISGHPTAVRASNSIGYFLPGKLGGFYGQAMYYLGENASTAGATRNDGKGYGVRVGYAAGPLNVAFATGRTRYAAGNDTQSNIGAQWDFGVARLMAMYASDKLGTVDSDGWLIGGLVPVGAGEVRLAYSQYTTDAAGPDPRSRKLALGYVHNLSKRTALYTTYARVRNTNGANQGAGGFAPGANNSSSGLDLGVRHSF